MSVNTAKASNHNLENYSRNLKLVDYAHLTVLAVHMAIIFFAIFYAVVGPFVCLLKPKPFIIFLLPLIWTWCDRNTPRTGGRRSDWFRKLRILNTFRDYFPTRLIKTADLPAGHNYILGFYPHSIIPFSILPNFLNNANNVTKLFPKIDMRFVAHDLVFLIPILRDYFLAVGGCSCLETSLKYLLNSKPSIGIIITPGGGDEINFAQPGSIYTILKSRRKGFIRLSLTTGAPLVPVFTFGEINTWNKTLILPIKWIGKFLIRGCPDIFLPIGRGFISDKFGFLPRKIPINTIVGAPIMVPKVKNPSQELIDQYHEQFFQALYDLFEKYKHQYDIAGSKAKLIMI